MGLAPKLLCPLAAGYLSTYKEMLCDLCLPDAVFEDIWYVREKMMFETSERDRPTTFSPSHRKQSKYSASQSEWDLNLTPLQRV